MKQITKNSFLSKVLDTKKEEIKFYKLRRYSAKKTDKKPNLFLKKITDCIKNDRIFVIAEVKLTSPTEQNLGNAKDIVSRAKDYEMADADAISFITDQKYFGGDIKYIPKLKKSTRIPVLQKDFVIDESQIYDAKNAGADALLIIAKILDQQKLEEFVSVCRKLNIEPVVEINSESELHQAINTDTRIIAVNSRNLESLEINTSRAKELLKKIPDKYIKLAFSGIKSYKDSLGFIESGANGILVGTSLMKTKNIERFLLSMRFRNDVKVKICGIRNLKEAYDAINSGADIIGFNFVKTSKRYINPAEANKIIKKIRGMVLTAVIFQNQDIEKIKKITDKLLPDFVQLHGEENKEYIKSLNNINIIKSIKENEQKLDFGSSFLLLDRDIQGTGKMFDLGKAKKLAEEYQIFFAGGLTPGNVAEIVRIVKPFGVDTAGGVETKGIKDKKKIKEFILNTRGVML